MTQWSDEPTNNDSHACDTEAVHSSHQTLALARAQCGRESRQVYADTIERLAAFLPEGERDSARHHLAQVPLESLTRCLDKAEYRLGANRFAFMGEPTQTERLAARRYVGRFVAHMAAGGDPCTPRWRGSYRLPPLGPVKPPRSPRKPSALPPLLTLTRCCKSRGLDADDGCDCVEHVFDVLGEKSSAESRTERVIEHVTDLVSEDVHNEAVGLLEVLASKAEQDGWVNGTVQLAVKYLEGVCGKRQVRRDGKQVRATQVLLDE
ncbi:MAG: hypothetical protein OEY28_07195, partial [Nitrospira sp.]|nr:hypothetical protein [Nitrospira sp.]